METDVKLLGNNDVVDVQDDLASEQHVRWEGIIERDMQDIVEGKPQKYITLDEFEEKLMAAVDTIYAQV